jgi:hypothetical protein
MELLGIVWLRVIYLMKVGVGKGEVEGRNIRFFLKDE